MMQNIPKVPMVTLYECDLLRRQRILSAREKIEILQLL